MAVNFLYASILFLSICTAIQETVVAEILVGPKSQSAPLWSIVNFTCEGIGKNLSWIVNDSSPDSTVKEERQIIITNLNPTSGNLSSVLTITALPVNDGTRIGCIIFGAQVTYSLSILSIKGVSEVENIKWFPESSLLTWSPPNFNSNDITNYDIQLENDNFNVTSNSIYLNITDCGQNVTITVFAGPYMSLQETVYIDTIYYNVVIDDYNVTIVDHNVTFDHIMVNASLLNLVNISAGHCNGSVIGTATCNDSIIGMAICNNCNNEKKYYPHEKIQEGGLVQYIMYNLEAHKMYTAVISLSNCFKIVQDKVPISTYYVQKVTISHYSNGSVSVRCVFLEGLTTDYCHIEFIETTQGLEESFNITGSVEVITLEKSGDYTLKAYDLLSNGTIIGPAFELLNVTITIPSKISPTNSVYDSTHATTVKVSLSAVASPSFLFSSPHIIITSSMTVDTSPTSSPTTTIPPKTPPTLVLLYVMPPVLVLVCILVCIPAALGLCLGLKKMCSYRRFRYLFNGRVLNNNAIATDDDIQLNNFNRAF